MFLDLTSSTAIAERIGHVQFLSLLRDFFMDVSEAVIAHGGEIYKYVGDEAIILWDREKGVKKQQLPAVLFYSPKPNSGAEGFLYT
ncbi:MAG: hypothetical protein ACLFR1_15935 [Spirochaetia bacterium]